MIKNLLNGSITQKELLNYYNTSITYKDLPDCVNGFVFNYKGIFNIIVNNSLSYYKKRKTILHELAHIELSQLEQIDNDLFEFYINKYEDDADNYIKLMVDERNKSL